MTKWVVLSKSIVNSECWDISMNPFLTTYLLSDITSTVWSWDVLNRCFSHLSIQVVFLPLPVPAPTRSWVRALCQHLLWESLTFICFHFLKLMYVQFLPLHDISLNQICNFSTFCWIFAMENNKLQIGLPSVFPFASRPCIFIHRRHQWAGRGELWMSQRPPASSTFVLTTSTTKDSSLSKLLWLRWEVQNCFICHLRSLASDIQDCCKG